MDNQNNNPFLDSHDSKEHHGGRNRLRVRDDAERAAENSMREYPTENIHIDEQTLRNMHADAIPEDAIMGIFGEKDDEDNDDSIHDEEQR